ncbi:alpha-2-macroglobulin-like protein 1 [Folsomia candida]|uniref:alpha-2-macroglobulin-like protein 1 n=1 Tax=Folsomia candida TaxID=158441 RepID=UPI001604DD58|nr:alpha-2-macroglobulin-like protein 1 [Folsomia candida]
MSNVLSGIFLLFPIMTVTGANVTTTPLLFSAVSSGVINRNLDFRVIATLYSAPEFPVIFNFSLAEERDPQNISLFDAEIAFEADGSKEVIIRTSNLSLASHYTLRVRVTSGSTTASGSTYVTTAANLILLSRRIKNYTSPGKLFLRPLKPKDNIPLEIWGWRSLNTSAETTGLMSLSFGLSHEPNHGNWKIIATGRDISGFAEFEVKQYVLPKFKLNVRVNQNFVTISSSDLVLDIDLKYTYGKPVLAICTIQALVSPRCPDKIQNFTIMTNVTTSLTLDLKKGLANVWDTLFEYYPIPTKISTICTETATGYVQNLTTWLPMYKHLHTLVVQDRPEIALAEHPYEVGIEVIWRNGSFAPAVNTTYRREDVDLILFELNGVNVLTETKILTDVNKYGKEMNISTGLSWTINDRRMTVKVVTTSPVHHTNVILISQGAVLGYRYSQFRVPLMEITVTLEIPLFVTYHKVEILAYTVSDGSLVSNKFHLTVPNPDVKIHLNANATQPGATLEIMATGFQDDSRSIFGVRAIDTSLLIATEDVDLAHSWIHEKLEYKKRADSEYKSIYSSFTFQNFVNSDTRIITIAFVDTATRTYRSYHERDFQTKSDIHIRKHFPETWIWQEMESTNGTIKFNKTVPDTITSWKLPAFKLHTEYGLRITTYPKILTVFKPFFIRFICPHSVVKGEELILRIVVQSYLDEPVNATVTLNNPNQYFRFLEIGGEQAYRTKFVAVNVSSIATLAFRIGYVHHGNFELEASAVTPTAVDSLKQKIVFKHAGIKHTNSKVLIKPQSKREIYSRQKMNASFPSDLIAESEEIKITLTQDFLSTTLENLETLIQIPIGCEYLEVSGSITTSLKAAILNYLELGYQQQLSYFNKDGSFSAFQFEEIGSTWLTAFVTRAFLQAKKYITIDQYILKESVDFLLGKQQQDGSFQEDGFVHDRSLLGGAVLKKDKVHSESIANWLISQKNAQGGFLSTQDTIMGITALAKYHEFANISHISNTDSLVNATITWEGGSQTYALGRKTKQAIYETDLPRTVRNVRVETEGKGASQVQLSWSYDSEIPTTNVSFSLDITVENCTTLRNLVLRPCAAYNKDNSSNMVVLEMYAPSGYSFNSQELNSLLDSKLIQRYELREDSSRLFMYFASFPGRIVKCFDLTITKEYEAEVMYTIPETAMIVEE